MTVKVEFPVIYLDPRALKPYWRNAKLHPRRQITQLANAIRRVGFDQPIVVDADHLIIKGHGRTLAALELKMPLVPVVVRDDLSAAEVMASRIADNQANSMTVVDQQKEAGAIQKYADLGGTFSSEFFDFMSPKAAKVSLPSASAKTAPLTPVDVAGALMVCPKCSKSFMEATK